VPLQTSRWHSPTAVGVSQGSLQRPLLAKLVSYSACHPSLIEA
jgi:hypothetical protein